MSTALQARPVDTEEKNVVFVPLGERAEIELKIGTVRKFLAVKTRSGKAPDDSDIIKFMMLCKARELNPWTGDAYLVGYDAKDGPKFSLITAVQALFKRAEVNVAFDGIESGVIVERDGKLDFREGDFLLDSEALVGGWAKCYRKDRSRPFYDALNFSTFDQKYSRWEKDPAGMIVKCAEASVLRKAFPSQTAGMYTAEELGYGPSDRVRSPINGSTKRVTLSPLNAQLTHRDVGNGADESTPDDDQVDEHPDVTDLLAEAKAKLAECENLVTLSHLYDGLRGPDAQLTQDQWEEVEPHHAAALERLTPKTEVEAVKKPAGDGGYAAFRLIKKGGQKSLMDTAPQHD